jgi:hypothetical protein
MNPSPDRPQLRISSTDGLLAAIPHLLGFTPETSLVVLGALPQGSVQITFRYDLPDPPDPVMAAGIAEHATAILTAQHLTSAVLVGYGPGQLVSPVADAILAAVSRVGLDVRDVLRVEDGRYWSYLCTDPSCCPPDGVPFDAAAHPAAAALAETGRPVVADRAALAATIAPLTGPAANSMRTATRRAERTAVRLIARDGPHALDGPGLDAVGDAIRIYRDGGSLRPDARSAWLTLALIRLRIRDDAWARMDPAHRGAHRRLWTDVLRRAQPGYIAAPASLLAFTAWQSGEGALANIALDRALADTPDYTMALLLRDALGGALPPSMAVPPMTPEEITASYAHPGASTGTAGEGDTEAEAPADAPATD